ncbi:carboxyl transferase domain-containing protein [Nocardiopsis sp. LOL_012]|uniref:acetyl-CoA carboxylase family protein n=1 Tax=Nocardiopsis sp. LOL_012 TaxID=3345409 RepID=UPI003A840A53
MTSVLIANRGEIAVRIVRAARVLGLGTVAVHTPDDRAARHVRLADRSKELSGDGYLDARQLVAAARDTGCALVHPGYGFLSESAAFARLCEKSGLVFVGPPPEVLTQLGDKAAARALARSLDVPVLRATGAGATAAEAADLLRGLGPGSSVMVKAVAGGGGRGMRAVHRPEDLAEAFERCASEAERAFGDGAVYAEELLTAARHVEVQVIGDGTGAVAHMWDRECSIQRRNQKLIEMAPSTLAPAERAPLLEAARSMAAAVRYRGLGTVEFLVDARDPARWFFLEANPRVQVEHTVTEEVTGIDLVAAQLGVALGRTLDDLGLTQGRIPEPRGTALQARVNLERLSADGTARPTFGRIEAFEVPTGPGVRVDTHGHTGLVADGRYDSLLAKVVLTEPLGGLDRVADRAEAALAEFAVEGPGTNIDLLRAILRRPELREGRATTAFLDTHLAELVPEEADAPAADTDRAAAPCAGTVVSVPAGAGDRVEAGEPLVVLESMKMEHVVAARVSGTVREVRAAVGETVTEGQVLARLEPDAEQSGPSAEAEEIDLDAIRPDLAAVLERHAAGLDGGRPEAVAKRRRIGHRTARENIDDLCDEGSFAEYGALAVAAQRRRRSMEDLVANTPADGMVTGIGRVNGSLFGDASRCVVMSYDYTVLAGTQGHINHRKTDRMLDLAGRQGIPVVLFAEGGGGRPGDTDTASVSGLHVPTFSSMGRLSGRVPTVGIASGRCFAGNAALLGCCDTVIATEDATIGMGGPAMIEGGGLGRYRPEEVGPVSTQVPNGVVDVLVADEAEAVATVRRYLSYFQGPVDEWACADQRRLRHVVPENRVRVYDVREGVRLLADDDSVLELRAGFGRSVVTALVRVEGRPMGLVANDPSHLGGAIDADSADKLARFLQLCDAHGLPVVSLCDTPGFMVGPDAERTATVRHFSRLFVTGAHLRVPVLTVVLRKAYGLGAQAMAGGGFHSPDATVAWPSGEVGAMGIEGSVRLGFRRELEAIEDPGERERAFADLVADAYERGRAASAAAVFELDAVIDPADTRRWITSALPAVGSDQGDGHRFVDTW